MIKGVTKTGFHYQIDENKLNDIEFFEMIAEVDENPLVLPKLLEAMLGSKQKKKLYNHCRTKSGNVPIDAVSRELEHIFSSQKDLKK